MPVGVRSPAGRFLSINQSVNGKSRIQLTNRRPRDSFSQNATGVILFVMSGRKIINETFTVSRKRGNGLLRREVWVDRQGRIARYNLAYINQAIYPGDNGRVVGYDNAHGYHHRHRMGVIEEVRFVSFEDIEARFEQDWRSIGGKP